MPKPVKIEFESPSPHSLSRSKSLFYEKMKSYRDKTATKIKYLDYRPPRLIKGKKWYIEYYYKIPPELQPLYKGRKWKRFIVNSFDINRYKDAEYAETALRAWQDILKEGFNPFEKDQIEIEPTPQEMTMKDAFEFFLTEQKGRGLEPKTYTRYEQICRSLNAHFVSLGIYKVPVKKIVRKHIESYLFGMKENKGWSNRQYNNIRNYIATVFEYLRKKEIIEKNPVEGIERLKSTSKKHRYFDKHLFPKAIEIIKINQPYLWYAVQFVYYLGVRSSKELRLLKVGDFIEGGELCRFRAEATKSDRDEFVPVDPNLKLVLNEMKIFDYPSDFYIFGKDKKPAPNPVHALYFSDKFSSIRKLAGLSSDYTMYGFRHTRVVHLLKDGAKLSDVARLLRHTDIAMTAKYARDLGVDFDSSELQRLTRKI